MKLTEEQVASVLRQTEASPIPDDNPVLPQLRGAFGDHTFYADANGLHVFEPLGGVEAAEGETRVAIVQIAEWTDENRTNLAPVEPRALGAIDLAPGSQDGGDAA